MIIKLRIAGIVQGVGFRPFVYRLARENDLKGWVYNDSQGVLVLLTGEASAIENFQSDLLVKVPPMAVIAEVKTVDLKDEEICQYEDFRILPSPQGGKRQVFISPDIATCPDCIQELKNKADRRYNYAFINCTNCGPRYSIIETVPYDRINTTMQVFAMCKSCQEEYANPLHRRFHAQPNACADCGPHYWLKKNDGSDVQGDALSEAKKLLMAGYILAIKGIGGYHLACDARNEAAVSRLRARKHREAKPFAVMAGSLALAKRLCYVNEAEEKWLTSPVAPVVLMNRRQSEDVAKSVAPANPYLGIMLPYAPVHHILLDDNDVLVMTSGNISQEPIVYKDEEALAKLAKIADFFLGHNREIAYRVDDSVMRVIKRKNGSCHPLIMRRSRGMAPAPIAFANSTKSILACGAELKNTLCLTKNDVAFISEHIGDLANLPIYASYQKILAHYEEIFSIKPKAVVCDMHPAYFASNYARKLAKERSLPLIEVQHHHAHIAAVLAEHNIEENVIGIAWDGTGYGPDGAVWGGEFLAADCRSYRRMAHFNYLPLPGGDKAAQEPWRQAAWCLTQLFGTKAADYINKLPDVSNNWSFLIQATNLGISSVQTSSTGRLFDTASAILGICGKNSYEGQAAVMLELAAYQAKDNSAKRILPYSLHKDKTGCIIIDILPAFKLLAEEKDKTSAAELALAFHYTMADIILRVTDMIYSDIGISTVVLSGGVFQNKLLLEQVLKLLEGKYRVLLPELLPINDGGLALGQAAIGSYH